MRVSKKVVKILQENIEKSFGNVRIYLFGSRTDDTQRGGDIDIAIDTKLQKQEFRYKRLRLLGLLAKIDFDYKVDIVNYNTQDGLLHREIQSNCIVL
jgi:predicted nucleotidyltransferase